MAVGASLSTADMRPVTARHQPNLTAWSVQCRLSKCLVRAVSVSMFFFSALMASLLVNDPFSSSESH